jgi:hypothetical protein
MIYRNGFGYLRQIPDGQFADGLDDYSEVIYDRFGNALGFPPIAALLPFAAKLLPAAAAILPGLISKRKAAAPAPPPTAPAMPPVSFTPPAPVAPTIIQVPVPMPMMPPIAPPTPVPGAQRLVLFTRRRPRRRVRVRLRVREEVTAPHAAAVREQPPLVSVSPRAPVPAPLPAPSVATELSGAFYAPFGFFR